MGDEEEHAHKKKSHSTNKKRISLTLTAHDDLRDTALCAAALLSGIKPEADKVQAIFVYVRIYMLCVVKVKSFLR
jgi:hypothetical protein|tara:strand:+ start:931 stop:1155 length:225 start_codon:yes stop_codon:yes gene_type:complete